MKHKRIRLAALFVTVGGFAYLAAATLVAQVPRQRPAKQKNVAAPPTVTETVITPGREVNDGKDGPGDESLVLAMFAMKPLSVQVNGHVVTISAKSLFLDRKPGATFVWGLKIVPKGGGVEFVNRVYDQQAFQLQTKERHFLTFDEDVRLNTGEYTAEVRVYSVRNDNDINQLKKGNDVTRAQTMVAESRADLRVSK